MVVLDSSVHLFHERCAASPSAEIHIMKHLFEYTSSYRLFPIGMENVRSEFVVRSLFFWPARLLRAIRMDIKYYGSGTKITKSSYNQHNYMLRNTQTSVLFDHAACKRVHKRPRKQCFKYIFDGENSVSGS